MEYKKQYLDNFNIHYINTDRFKAINIEIFFTKKFLHDDIALSNLLCNMMTYSTKKYNTKNKYSIKKEELYSLKMFSKSIINGASNYINFSLEFLNPKYTEDSMLIESLDFYKEVLFNPNVKDGSFDENTFNLIKENFISRIDASKDDPSVLSELNFRKVMYEGTPSAYSSLDEKEVYERVTAKALYDFYLTLFKNYKIDVFVLGEISTNYENIITEYIKKIFKNVIPLNNERIELYINQGSSKRSKEVVEKANFKQTHLIMGYRLKNISEYELKYVFTIYNIMLGSVQNSVLFTNLRSKNSLCYTVYSSRNIYNPSLIIYSGISKDNKDKAIKLVGSSIKDMTKLSTIKPLLNISLKTINTILNDYYDDFGAMINYYYNSEFDNIANVEERREILMNVTPEEIMEFAKKVEHSLTYVLEEGEK